MSNDKLKIENLDGGVVLSVKVVPGSSRTAIAGVLGGMLKVKVAAPAEKGKANKCLIEFLAGQLGVRKAAVSIILGQTGPLKTVRIGGVSGEAIMGKLIVDKQRGRL
jgi:uncharacterized protein (TIGR00251 family)